MGFRSSTKNWKSKIKAFAIHFGISLVIFSVLLYFLFFQWYPFPFFSTDGGTQGLRLIIFVDLVLGPALTFIVFNRDKPLRLLKLDLAVIAIAQVAALGWGIWAVQNERPVAIVFADDRFNPIPYYQFVEAGLKVNDLKKFGDRLPVSIFVSLPGENDLAARSQLFFESFRTNTPLFLMGDRFQAIDENALMEISKHSIDIEAYLKEPYLKDKRAEMEQTYRDFLQGSSKSEDEYLYLALYARYCKCILVAERATLKFVDVIKIPPPQITQKEIKISKQNTSGTTE